MLDPEMKYLEHKYEVLATELEKTHNEIKDWTSRNYKNSRRFVTVKGVIRKFTDINEDHRKKVIDELNENIKELHKGIDYIQQEMEELNAERMKDMSYGWTTVEELEWK